MPTKSVCFSAKRTTNLSKKSDQQLANWNGPYFLKTELGYIIRIPVKIELPNMSISSRDIFVVGLLYLCSTLLAEMRSRFDMLQLIPTTHYICSTHYTPYIRTLGNDTISYTQRWNCHFKSDCLSVCIKTSGQVKLTNSMRFFCNSCAVSKF